MKTVIVTSQNPVKIETVQEAFGKAFPEEVFDFISFSADSNVSDQPKGQEETLSGARNRIAHGKQEYPDADFYVGLEGGIQKIENQWECVAWMVVQDSAGKEGKSQSASHSLPLAIQKLIDEGMELGHAGDIVFNQENIKHKNGVIGILTGDLVTRKDYYVQPLIFALTPFKKKELF